MNNIEVTKKTFLIVYANPNEKSICHSAYVKAIESIVKRGHNVLVSDLYKINFYPVCGVGDFKEREKVDEVKIMDEQLHSTNKNLFVDELNVEMEKLKKADHIILIFPVWWGSCPAIMKGWFDRVLANGVAWTDDNLFHTGKFLGKRGQVISVTAGSEEEYSLTGDHKETIDMSLSHILRGTLAFCGFDVLPLHHLFCCYACGDQKINEFINKIDDIIENFEKTDLFYKNSK